MDAKEYKKYALTRALILFIQTSALYKSFTYLLTYLDWDQSNYSSRIFSHIWNLVKPEIAPFDPPTPKTPTVEPNIKWIG